MLKLIHNLETNCTPCSKCCEREESAAKQTRSAEVMCVVMCVVMCGVMRIQNPSVPLKKDVYNFNSFASNRNKMFHLDSNALPERKSPGVGWWGVISERLEKLDYWHHLQIGGRNVDSPTGECHNILLKMWRSKCQDCVFLLGLLDMTQITAWQPKASAPRPVAIMLWFNQLITQVQNQLYMFEVKRTSS